MNFNDYVEMLISQYKLANFVNPKTSLDFRTFIAKSDEPYYTMPEIFNTNAVLINAGTPFDYMLVTENVLRSFFSPSIAKITLVCQDEEVRKGYEKLYNFFFNVEEKKMPHILEKTESLVVNYQAPVDFTNQQLKIFWLPDEISVEKDVQDVLVNFSESEKHGIMTTLKLFSLYELKAGAEYWGERFKNTFPRPEFQRMAATFAMFELAVHKPFYNKINELLHVSTDEFYTSYVKDPTLKSRIEYIDSIVDAPNDAIGNLFSLGAFSMVEGAILYSSFAFIKHFQSKGKNKLLNIVRGINFSVRDEHLHSVAGAWAFKALKEQSNLSNEDERLLKETLVEAAKQLYEHEVRIVEMIFEKGAIDGITEDQMKSFVQSRVNACLQELGYDKIYEISENPIADWFYDGINGYQFNDFFSGMGNQYHRNWDPTKFTWKKRD